MSQNCPPVSSLSLRQRQVLELIRQGKSNHEIAFELGIGVGTVKQHVVALFRKLKVTSRTMAVSRESQNSLFGRDHSLGNSKDVILERRPCIVLSMVLENPEPDALRRLHGNMARVAQDAGDIVLSWRSTGCDIILGIEQSEESGPIRALRSVQTIVRTHADQGRPGGRLKGALAAGLAVASMFRRGGWSGEAIASSSIVLARHRTAESAPGRLFLDQTFMDLLRVCDASIISSPSHLLLLDDMFPLLWHKSFQEEPIAPRLEEYNALQRLLEKSSKGKPIVCLWGDAGVGKSWLCAKLATVLAHGEQAVNHFKCLPLHAPSPFLRVDDGLLLDGDALIQSLAKGAFPSGQTARIRNTNRHFLSNGQVLILDNTHWLDTETSHNLLEQVLKHDYRVLYVSRRPLENNESVGYHLRPIKDSVSAKYFDKCFNSLAQSPGLARKAAQSLTAMAGGNPFIIRELTRSHQLLFSHLHDEQDFQLPLSITLRIAAHFDAHRLDRRMLRFVGQSPQGMTLKDLALVMGEEEGFIRETVDAASTSSILYATNSGRIVFKHQICQRVTQYLGMDI